jgi:hypothetical protein
LEVDFWNEANVHFPTSKGCLNCNVTTVPSHKTNNSNSILSRSCLNLCRINKLERFCNCSVESEAPVDQRNIVINSFWDTTDRYLDPLSSKCVLKLINTSMSAVSSNDEELRNFSLLKSSDHLRSIKSTPGRAKDSST